jgi:polyisoprenoid-binding protein YceI
VLGTMLIVAGTLLSAHESHPYPARPATDLLASSMPALVAPATLPAHGSSRLPATPPTKEIVLTLDTSQSKVQYTLGTTLHTVHGSFAFKRGTIGIDPETGAASGEIVADAASGESGDSSRDKKMHKDVLESARFPEVVFRPDRVEGRVPSEGAANVQLHGTLLLHGSQHELTVPIQAELTTEHWKGSAKFRIPYIDWGLKSPSNFLLKADPVVDLELEMTGAVQTAQRTAAPR